jgi:hypothetical protein
MSDPSIRASQIARKVLCPDCGALLSARGLQGHRRLSHGIAADRAADRLPERASDTEPGSLVRRKEPESSVEFLPQLVRSFDELLALLRRLESRLENLENSSAERAAIARQRQSDARVVEESLHSVLNEISRVQNQWRAVGAARGVAPKSDADTALEETTFVELGKLRRRQASLLFRLRELEGEDRSDEALCS